MVLRSQLYMPAKTSQAYFFRVARTPFPSSQLTTKLSRFYFNTSMSNAIMRRSFKRLAQIPHIVTSPALFVTPKNTIVRALYMALK